jgi:nitrogen fixation protein FixH
MQKGLQWPIGIAAVLVITVAANVYVAVRANDDPSMSVEPDYYQKAVRFDADQALRRRGERLGWRVAIDATPGTDAATVTARLEDSTGAPLHGATVRLRARHVARGNEPVSATAAEQGDHYVATMAMTRLGLWDVDIEIVRGNSRFVTEQRLELSRPR